MLREAFGVHAFAVIHDNNRRALLVEIWRQKHRDLKGSGVERVCHELFDRLVRRGVQPFREQLNELIAEQDADFRMRSPDSLNGGLCWHVLTKMQPFGTLASYVNQS